MGHLCCKWQVLISYSGNIFVFSSQCLRASERKWTKLVLFKNLTHIRRGWRRGAIADSCSRHPLVSCDCLELSLYGVSFFLFLNFGIFFLGKSL